MLTPESLRIVPTRVTTRGLVSLKCVEDRRAKGDMFSEHVISGVDSVLLSVGLLIVLNSFNMKTITSMQITRPARRVYKKVVACQVRPSSPMPATILYLSIILAASLIGQDFVNLPCCQRCDSRVIYRARQV